MTGAEYVAEVSKLREQNDLLRAELRAIKQARVDTANIIALNLGLGRKESAVLAMLVEANGHPVSTERLWLLWDDSTTTNIKIVSVHICNIRKKLKPQNMKILTIWGQGYFVCEETAARLKAITGVQNVAHRTAPRAN